ncbi:peptidoglycan-binding domain-containing protein [Catelliglobosispora koreensis]|uniref:peptidoglycan-binding domain-containing protein n=1 Tax=Catelliglobosispora koreensis TaxID=129052 RepID=UPI00037933AC|nr:peptidoglycan-binding domain-containing protein [Catelliglobosispora koreensis]
MTRISRRTGLGLIAAIAVGTGIPAYYVLREQNTETPPQPLLPKTTAKVTRQTMVQSVTIAGKLGYGVPVPLTTQAQGVLTWLPAVGTIVERGETLFRANEQPIVLMHGPLPMYRPLAIGVKGPDVKQFKDNLRVLNYAGVNTDETFSSATEAAVKRWQKANRLDPTGVVDLGRVVYTDGPVRIAQHTVRIGTVAAGEILSYTATVRLVSVDVPAAQAAWAVKGTAVTVVLPADKSIAGEITDVGTEAAGDGDNGSSEATIPVKVSIVDQSALGSLEKAPVEVRYVAQKREGVLAVPVAALLALAEGGYGLELVEGSTTRILAVETGMAANGFIEIRGEGLAEGQIVGVAG